jgi:hypothetical protein
MRTKKSKGQEIRDRERQEMEKPKIRNEEVKKGSEMEKF